MLAVIILILVVLLVVFWFAAWILEAFWWLILLGIIAKVWFRVRTKREQEQRKREIAAEDYRLEPRFLPKVQAAAENIATAYGNNTTAEGKTTVVLYTLQLRERKYYVGIIESRRFESRMHKHFDGDGTHWTQRYKPVDLLNVIVLENIEEWSQAEALEDAQTLRVMEMFGAVDVRGGRFTAVDWSALSHWLREHGYALVKERKGPFSHLLKVRAPGKELYWKRLNEALNAWENATNKKLGMLRRM